MYKLFILLLFNLVIIILYILFIKRSINKKNNIINYSINYLPPNINYDISDNDTIIISNNIPGKTIWILWLPGWDQAPSIVHDVYHSWKLLNPEWNIELISADNLNRYIYNSKNILNNTFTTDVKKRLIQFKILHQHGGVWVDPSVICNNPLDNWIYELLQPSGFWALQSDNVPDPSFMISIKESNIMNQVHNYIKDIDKDDMFYNNLLNKLYNNNIIYRSEWNVTPNINYNKQDNLIKLPKNELEAKKLINVANNKLNNLSFNNSQQNYIYRDRAYNLSNFIVVASDCNHSDDTNKLEQICIDNNVQLFIYDKCNFCKHIPSHILRRPLKNVGREAHTFITFILDHYDNIPNDVVFVAGHLSKHNRDQRLIELIQSNNLGCSGSIQDIGDFTIDHYDKPLLKANIRPLRDWYESRIGDWHDAIEGPCWNGMMHTNRERILRTPIEKLKLVKSDLDIEDSCEVAHYMERAMANVY